MDSIGRTGPKTADRKVRRTMAVARGSPYSRLLATVQARLWTLVPIWWLAVLSRRLADCAGCHTAGPGHPPFAGGLAISSPAGTIYSTNITPDPDFGIGNYSYEDFSRALREGIAKGERHLYPAMPYPSFAAISDSDVRALYAYFMKSVKAVNQKPPQTALPFPFNQRWMFRFWNAAFAKRERYQPKADRGKWNRGAYLVQALGIAAPVILLAVLPTRQKPIPNRRRITSAAR